MIVAVSGKAFEAGLNPLASGAPAEHGWPAAQARRVGRGWAMTYDLTIDQAQAMHAHLTRLADGFKWSDDADAKADGRAMRAAAAKIADAIEQHQ